jgi:radical SAM protein with 4Fe4S-binding SPASM domain
MHYSPFRHLGSIVWKRRPIHLTCFLTRRCNASCPYCFYLADEARQKAAASELSVQELAKVADSLGSLLWLAFSGGEIFLRHDLHQIVVNFYKKNRPAIILLPTNGLQMETIIEQTEAILRSCPRSTIAVKLSLDGPAAVHDALRGRQGSFDKTMATCEALGGLLERYDNFELGINSVFCADNQAHLTGFTDFINGLAQVKTHTVSLIRGQTWDSRLTAVDLELYRQVIAGMEKNLKACLASVHRFRGGRPRAPQDILQRRLILRTARERKRLLPCYAGRLNLVLTENGDLYPCESFAESMKLGNAREYDLDLGRMLQSQRAGTILNAIEAGACYCTHECFMITNILFNPRQYPALFKTYLEMASSRFRRRPSTT